MIQRRVSNVKSTLTRKRWFDVGKSTWNWRLFVNGISTLMLIEKRWFDVDKATRIQRWKGNDDSTLTSQRRIDVGCSTLIKRCGHNLKKTLMQFTISTSFFNVYSTSLSENFNVDSTLIQRWINVVCPLGRYLWTGCFDHHEIWFDYYLMVWK